LNLTIFPPNEAGALFNLAFNGASLTLTKVSTDLKILIIEVLRDNITGTFELTQND